MACNNNPVSENYKELYEHDSLLIIQTQEDDSAIKGYVAAMNEIQDNLDQIKAREKIISRRGEGKSGSDAIADIEALYERIIEDQRQLNKLQVKLKKLSDKDTELRTMTSRLNSGIAEQDTQMNELQNNLSKINAAYRELSARFNDSIRVMRTQNAKIIRMTNAMNTVYYAIGTMRELKDSNVIKKSGGFAGIGRNEGMSPDFNAAFFTKANSATLHVIPLHGRFRKLISNHPSNSYKITANGKMDSLYITNTAAFWNESKYLVIAVKQ